MSDTITEDRVATLHSLLNDAAKKVGAQRQTISELRAALEPFARLDHNGLHYPTDGELLVIPKLGGRKAGKTELCLSDFRRAAAAIAKATGEA
jgi:hypothetical protein